WLVWAHAWAWSVVWKRRADIATKLNQCIAEGTLTRCEMGDEPALDEIATGVVTEDEADDLTEDLVGVVDVLVRVREAGLFPASEAIGLDPAGVATLVDELAKREFDDDQLKAIPQGWRLSSAIKGAARKVAARTLRHDGSELLTWCVGNVKQEPRGTSGVAITKQTPSAKIDPVAAMFSAAMLMSLNPEAAGESVYENRGVRSV
ncbi:MAG: terminase large subunit, partial [Sphingomonas bacterium]|nr:terminase large subunit [Sphingomonas bacterium]